MKDIKNQVLDLVESSDNVGWVGLSVWKEFKSCDHNFRVKTQAIKFLETLILLQTKKDPVSTQVTT